MPSAAGRLRSAALAERSGAFALLAVLAVAAALMVRLAFRIDYAEEVDSIRFLAALDRFDVAAYQPHFPGYPVFVALGRVFRAFLGEPLRALATLCAVAGALLPVPVALVARALAGARAGALALLLVAVDPALWLYSEKLLSDMAGLLILFVSLAAVVHGLGRSEATPGAGERSPRLLAAGFFLLGLTLGVRLSYFPFVLTVFALSVLRRERLAPLAAAAAVGVLCWAIPLVLATGWGPLTSVALVQGHGHFERWGGTVITIPDLGQRATALAWQLLAQGAGTWWSDRPWPYLVTSLALAVVVGCAWRRGPPHRPKLVWWAIVAGPYLAWTFLGQNVTLKSRHALPLVALLTVVLAGALARATAAASARRSLPLSRLAAVALVTGQSASGLALVGEHRSGLSNTAAAARALARVCSEAHGRPVVVYTATLRRQLERDAPCVEPVEVRWLREASRDLARRGETPLAFVVSDVAHSERMRGEAAFTFRQDRYTHDGEPQLSVRRMGGDHG
jgi:hypothetical protein